MMPANVKTMFYVGETPWHGIGTKIPDAKQLSVAEALEVSGGNYEVEAVPQFVHDMIDVGGKQELISTQTEQVCIRHAENKTIYGYSGKRYQPYQNKDAFELFQPLVDSEDIAFETGGVLGEGEICWILAQINKPNLEVVRGDEVSLKLLLSNPHDGLHAIGFGLTPIRVVCQNTLAMAMNSNQSKIVKIKHNRNSQTNLEIMRDALSADMLSFETTIEKYRFLASRGCNRKDLMKFVKVINGLDEDTKFEDVSTRKQNIMDRMVQLVESGMGQDNPQVRGTWWGAYNGYTQYLNWEKGNSTDKRLTNLWFSNENKKVFDVAMKYAQSA
jgi:phage/plasmid-like protein (TIGR03299 family)